MKRILITGAGGNAAINFINSLRMTDEKYYIVGVDVSPEHLECSPVDTRYLVPRVGSADYLPVIKNIVEAERIEFLHPQPDIEVAYWAQHRSQLPCRTFLPSSSIVSLCHDKAEFAKLMEKSAVPVPRSFLIDDFEDLESKMQTLKRQSDIIWCRARRGAGSKAALPVKSFEQARNWINYWVEMKGLDPGDFMISEYLPGKEYAFQSLWLEGEMITSMARERLEYMFGNLMPSGQSSSPSIAKTVHREDVNQIAAQAIKAVDPCPSGIYCVDLKENSASVPCVTEINIGRFFTTSNFFSEAGINMPYLYTKIAFLEDIPKVPQFNPVPNDLFWVRGVDRVPRLFRGNKWTSKKF